MISTASLAILYAVVSVSGVTTRTSELGLKAHLAPALFEGARGGAIAGAEVFLAVDSNVGSVLVSTGGEFEPTPLGSQNDHLQTYGALFGRIFSGSTFSGKLATGVTGVNYTIYRCGRYCKDESGTTIGMPVDASVTYRAGPLLLGSGIIANLNPKLSWVGLVFSVGISTGLLVKQK